MTKIILQKMYCDQCKKSYEVEVLLSTNSRIIQHDPVLRQRAVEGTLFKNFCPVCNKELVSKDNE